MIHSHRVGLRSAAVAACTLAVLTCFASPILAQTCETNRPPQFGPPSPGCDTTFTARAGVPITFVLRAFDPDEGDSVTLSLDSVPSGATTEPALPIVSGGPTTTFSWTPLENQAGDHLVAIRAVDECGAAQVCSLTVTVIVHEPPDCSAATASVTELWPPNKRMVPIHVRGISDPDGDSTWVEITEIWQDEPSRHHDDDDSTAYCADAEIDDDVARVRATRLGSGNGRIYTIRFRAFDADSAWCDGEVQVCVPHDRGRGHGGDNCIDDGARYVATAVCDDDDGDDDDPKLKVFETAAGVAQIDFVLKEAADVTLVAYDVSGRRIATIDSGRKPAGAGRATWTVSDPKPTMYFVRLKAGEKSTAKRVFFRR